MRLVSPTIRRVLRSDSGRRSAPSRRGVTVVELVMTIVLMTIAGLGAFAAQIASRDLIRQSAETSTAMTDLQSAMEEMLLFPAAEIPVNYPANQPLVGYQGLNLTGQTVVPTYPNAAAGGVVPDVLEIQLTLNWTTFEGGQRTLTLSSGKGQ